MSLIFDAILVKAQTTVDGGWRVTFDTDMKQSQKLVELAEMRDQILQIEINGSHGEQTVEFPALDFPQTQPQEHA